MVVHAVRSVLATGLVDRVSLDVPERPEHTLLACAGLPVDLAAPWSAGAIRLRHDARRPLTPPGLIAAVVAAVADGYAAAVAVLPLTDTVKVVGPGGLVCGTPDRAGLRVVQAPRAWRAELADPDTVPAHAVPGDPLALSIRTTSDLELARLLVGTP